MDNNSLYANMPVYQLFLLLIILYHIPTNIIYVYMIHGRRNVFVFLLSSLVIGSTFCSSLGVVGSLIFEKTVMSSSLPLCIAPHSAPRALCKLIFINQTISLIRSQYICSSYNSLSHRFCVFFLRFLWCFGFSLTGTSYYGCYGGWWFGDATTPFTDDCWCVAVPSLVAHRTVQKGEWSTEEILFKPDGPEMRERERECDGVALWCDERRFSQTRTLNILTSQRATTANRTTEFPAQTLL